MLKKPVRLHDVFVLLGSNLGDSINQLGRAQRLIELMCGRIMSTSSIYRTAAWGNRDQPDFYNQVIGIKTALAPDILMNKCLAIEAQMGRKRQGNWTPRIIDIDLLLYDEKTITEKNVTIPHPRLHLRKFTLIPLAEIAPDHVHPIYGMTITELLKVCSDQSEVEIIG